MKATIAAAIAALLLPLPAAAQWLSPAASQSYNSWQQTQQRLQMQQQEYRIQQLESQQRQQQGFYQTRYQCGSSFYQCRWTMDAQTIAKLQAAAKERLKTDPHASYVLTLLLQDSEGIAWINGRYKGERLVAAARRLQADGLVGTVFEAMRGRFACTVAR